nr:hypothetical protein [Ignicoccus hospitalis]
MSLWPKSLCTAGKLIPLLSASVAKVCLSAWGWSLCSGKPAFLANLLSLLYSA